MCRAIAFFKDQHPDLKANFIMADLKVDIILTLAKRGYPPVANYEVCKDILEQAEKIKEFRSKG